MSDNTHSPIFAPRSRARSLPRGTSLADHPLVQLTLVRFREFLREPEALFWVFVFPLLLAAGLGIAFRNRPADVLKIAAVTPELAQSLAAGETSRRSAAGSCGRGRCVYAPGKSLCSLLPGPAAQWCIGTTIPIPKAAPRACWQTVPSSKPPAVLDPVPSSDLLMREPGRAISTF